MAGVTFQEYKGYKYRIKNGYLYCKGWNFGLSVDAIVRKYGSIEEYFDDDILTTGLTNIFGNGGAYYGRR